MSFCNNNIIDVASDRGSIYLGVWDTLNVRQQQFDVSAWLDAYGDDGVLTVLNQRRTDELPYEVADVTLEGGVATWTFDETDTAVVGEGKAALVYIRAGETIARTVPFPTYTAPTIGMSGSEPPDPWESWYTRILEAAADAQQAATDAAGSASDAIRDARRAEEAANDAAGSALDAARDAGAASDSAADAARDAGAASASAEAAAGSAEAAAGSAEAAAGSADDALGYATNAYDDAERADRAAEAATADAASIADSAEILADWQQHKYDAFATESAQGEAIKTDLGAALQMAKLDIVATAGSGTVTVRQNGVNMLDLGSAPKRITVLGTVRAGYALALPAGYYLFRLELTGAGNTYLNLAVISAGGTDVTCETDNRRLLYNGGTVPTVTRSEGGVVYTNGEAGIPVGREIVRVKIEDGDKLCIFSRDSYSAGVNQWNYVAGAQVELSAEVTNPFDSIAHPITAYTAVNTTVEVSGAGTYPVTPTPTTALGVNTLWIVPGSGVTATLDGTFRLDPTLIYNALRGA